MDHQVQCGPRLSTTALISLFSDLDLALETTEFYCWCLLTTSSEFVCQKNLGSLVAVKISIKESHCWISKITILLFFIPAVFLFSNKLSLSVLINCILVKKQENQINLRCLFWNQTRILYINSGSFTVFFETSQN